MTERWLPVVGYEGLYEVSDLGRVKRLARQAQWGLFYRDLPERIMVQTIKPEGYAFVGLVKNGRQKASYSHLLVLEAFVGPRPEGFDACHFPDGNWNNALTNLRWDDPSKNNGEDKRLMGTIARGETQGHSKLTEDDVRQIRIRCAAGDEQRPVAADYGVAQATIWAIVKRRTWAHVL